MSPLAQAIVTALRTQPRQFAEIVDIHRDIGWPEFLRAWGEVRQLSSLTRDDDGRYIVVQELDAKAHEAKGSIAAQSRTRRVGAAMSHARSSSARMTAFKPGWIRSRVGLAVPIKSLLPRQALHFIEHCMSMRFWPSNR